MFAYVLMTGRRQFMYKDIFWFLRDRLHIVPNVMMTDFEVAARKATRNIWPGATLKGCYVHFCRTLTRKANSNSNLARAIRSQSEPKNIFKMYQRLAYLPSRCLREGLQSIKENIRINGLENLFRNFHRYAELIETQTRTSFYVAC